MVSKHCKINVATALEFRFSTCPIAGTTRSSGRILLLLRVCGAGKSCLCSKNELNPESDKHDLEDGTLGSCSSKMQ